MSDVSKKKVIGLTGSMGSGKSQVSKFIQQYYPVLDCDQVNAKLLEADEEGFRQLKDKNLISILDNGQIDKIQLSKDMFTNPQIKKEVESILHPLIIQRMKEWVNHQDSSIVFVEVPLLFESKIENQFDEIWCVVADEYISLYRLETYRHISKEEAKRRLSKQWSVEDKKEKSDVVIENNGTLEELQNKIKKLLEVN